MKFHPFSLDYTSQLCITLETRGCPIGPETLKQPISILSYVILSNVEEVCVFEHEFYISTLENALIDYVLLASINKVCKYCYALVICHFCLYLKFSSILACLWVSFLATLFIFAFGYRPTLLGHTTG